jgi:RNA polymerase sigma-70 factor, ECF subfamily
MGEGTSVAVDPLAATSSPASPDEIPPFAVVYEQYFALVWSAAQQLGVSEDALDDVVQEIFLVIHARLSSVEQVASLRSWVYGVARRTVSTYRRARRSRKTTDNRYAQLADWLEQPAPTPQDITMLADRHRLLVRLLDELDDAKRELFVLSEVEDFTAPEIAEALNVPLNTVYSRLRAARQAFEQALVRYRAAQNREG